MSSYDFKTQTRYTISNSNAIDLFMENDVVIVDDVVDRCK
jgi:hypoxanthine-guanine phosphoribosyltransferase